MVHDKFWACKHIGSKGYIMLNTQNLINKICACVTGGGLTALQTCQTNGALQILCQPVCHVASFANLPDPVTYAGRMIYVCDERRYYHAVEGYWVNNFASTNDIYVDEIRLWGDNSSGQLGNGTTTARSSPVSVVGGFTDWCQISAGSGHTVAVRADGTTWAWGSNVSGQLGDNTATSRRSPVSVVGGFTDWCQVGAGGYHTMAVRMSGSAWSWGDNCRGQLGDGTTTTQSSPVSVVGGFSNWCAVSAGLRQTVAVRLNGTIWAWGRNSYGLLGDGTNTSRSSPVSVVGGFCDWCTVSASSSHSVAVRSSGTAWSWGLNAPSRLGDGTTINRSSPVSVLGGFCDWYHTSGGEFHTVAVRLEGTAWAWGDNGSGQLGRGNTAGSTSPVSVVGGFSDWCQISAGFEHTVAVRTVGTTWAWGYNSAGRLGDGTTTRRSSPVSVVGGFSDWCHISAGSFHTAAIRQAYKGF
jgi:hypothetical protein